MYKEEGVIKIARKIEEEKSHIHTHTQWSIIFRLRAASRIMQISIK